MDVNILNYFEWEIMEIDNDYNAFTFGRPSISGFESVADNIKMKVNYFCMLQLLSNSEIP